MHSERIPSQVELLQIFRKVGFRAPTPLQGTLVPMILKGRDIIVQTVEGSGKTAGIVVSLIIGLKGGKPGVKALIIVPTVADVAKVSRVWTRFARLLRDAPLLLALGETDDVRREQRRLEKGAAVVVGTVERVIDHIRRGSLLFDALETVFVDAPEGGEREDFTKDAQFIFAKFPARPQAILFSRAPVGEQEELGGLLHRPALVTPADLAGEEGRGGGEHLVVEVAEGRKSDALARLILGRRIPAGLVLYSPRTDGEALARALRRGLLRAEAVPANIAPANRRKHIAAFARRELEVLLLPLPSSGRLLPVELEELQPSHVIYYDLAPGGRASAGGLEGAGRPGTVLPHGAGVIALASGGQEKEIARLQEAIGVTMKSGEVPGDEEVLGSSIRRIVGRIRDEADPTELGRLRATIRRSVPFFMRSWFAAYLLKAHLPFEPAQAQPPAGAGKQGQGRQPLGRQPLGRQQVRPRAAAGPSGPAGAQDLRESERLEEARRREPLGRQSERLEEARRREPLGRQQREALREPTPRGSRSTRGERPKGEARREPIGRQPLGRQQVRPRAEAGPSGPAGAQDLRESERLDEARRREPLGRQQREALREPQLRQHAAAAQPITDGSGFTQLFVSIGRSRRVFARELTDLFVSRLHLEAGEIGDVRVFDKYSFVDIAAGRAAAAISSLSGTEVKGRPITVNYAKKKEEKEAR